MKTYPKIKTLFKRGEDKKVINELQVTDFDNVKNIIVLEKIDGTNAQIVLSINYETLKVNIQFCSRETEIKEKDVMFIANTCCKRLKLDKIAEWYYNNFALDTTTGIVKEQATEVRLFGEVYGAGINKGGKYSNEHQFRLFDIQVGNSFMNWSDARQIADKLEIKTAPIVYKGQIDCMLSYEFLKYILEDLFKTNIDEQGTGGLAEGLVIRSEPLLLNRFGERVIAKIKRSDFVYEVKKEKFTIEETNPEDSGRELKEKDA
jgi:hypothetical protein